MDTDGETLASSTMAENSTDLGQIGMSRWEPMPSYWDVAVDMTEMMTRSWRKYIDGKYRFPRDIMSDFEMITNFERIDVLTILGLAVGFTVFRTLLTEKVLRPMCSKLKMTEPSEQKMPESIWKFLYYTLTWSYTFGILILSGRYRFFQEHFTVWKDWALESGVPADIHWLYIIQLSFYIHGLYALFFQDAWRKDSVVMGLHHVITITLVSISFASRYHNVGALTMLCHDVGDIFLEFGKINVYLKVRGGIKYKLNDTLAGISFVAMLISWFMMRLYYFPLKVLGGTARTFIEWNFIPDYSLLMNSMLLILAAMNVFWFYQMLNLLYKIVITKELDEVDDLREYDVVEEIERKSSAENKKLA